MNRVERYFNQLHQEHGDMLLSIINKNVLMSVTEERGMEMLMNAEDELLAEWHELMVGCYGMD